MSTIRAVERHFSTGLRLAPPMRRLESPVSRYADVAPAELATVSALQQLFQLRDMNQVLLDALRPAVSDADLLKPACFLSALNSLPERLRYAAQVLPAAAPGFGRAALLVSSVIWLVNQGLSYQAAIVEA